MSEPEARGKFQAYSLAGEGMSKWLAFGFALIGLLTAVAAAWVFLTDRAALPEQTTRETTPRQEGSPADSVAATSRRTEPLPPSATPASTAAADDEQQIVPSQPPPPEPTAADGKPVEPPPEQAASNKTPSPTARVECPGVVTILFGSGSARPIDADIDARLVPLRAWLAEYPETKLLVEGHADSTGTEQWNLILSYRRAKALVALLLRSGVPQEQLVVRAAGTLQPITGLPDSAARNRRVVLQLEGGENCRASSTGSEPQS